jgi:PPOX class probable F420-dependent enzyme
VLCTIGPDGSARPVPVCFALGESAAATCLYTPLDDKPKRVADPRRLARVRDIEARAEVTLLVDRWDEDWSRLAWLRLDGIASLLEPGESSESAEHATPAAEHAAAAAALRARYPQYDGHDLAHRPLIRVVLTGSVYWDAQEAVAARRRVIP